MSLKIYHGSRIEDLAEKLVGELAAERKVKGPFDFLKVAVANPNLGNWLKMKVLAKVSELSAGVGMPFLDQQLADLLKAEYAGKLELISGRDYPVIVLDALMNHWRKEFAPFRRYVKEEYDPDNGHKEGVESAPTEAETDEMPLKIVSQREARKAVQLADRLAQLIDGYEATGNLGTLEKNKDANAVYGGEQALVETLFGVGEEKGLLSGKGKISLRQMFDAVSGRKPQGASTRVVLFGHTSLTDLQIKIIAWLSQTHEIVWYCPANILCADSKFDGKSADGVSSYNLDVDKTIKKLCLSLKETFGNAIYPDERIFNRPARDSVLTRLQSRMSRVGAYAAAAEKPQQDASVQIVGAPGVRREVEMVVLKEAKAAAGTRGDYLSMVGVPIMVTHNTPERNLFNGDVGVTVHGPHGMVVLFPRGAKTIVCPVALLPEHELAYAMTVHKSQGSEFENVMVVLPDDEQHPLLNRQIVYTGITRAKKRAVIVSTEAALTTALSRKLERDTGITLGNASCRALAVAEL